MGAYTVPALPYAYDALEPFVDARTLELHHTWIHQSHVDNLNRALQGTEELQALSEQSVADLLWRFGKVPAEVRSAVRNFGGGHANHSLFWSQLSGRGGGEPSGKLAEGIENDFGSFKDFRNRFSDIASTHFGSGWIWLVRTRQRLLIYALPNEDSPLATEETPILGLDVWEHAYYLRYEARRDEYIQAFWDAINWDEVSRRYEEGSGL